MPAAGVALFLTCTRHFSRSLSLSLARPAFLASILFLHAKPCHGPF